MGNTPSAVAYGAQLNRISTSLTCRYLNSADIFNVTLTATSPLQGQTYYHSDLTAAITLPNNFTRYGQAVGGDVSVDARIALHLTNATTTSIQLEQIVSQAATEPVVSLHFPSQQVTSNGISRLSLSGVNLTLLYKAVPYLGSFNVTCDEEPALIASVTPGTGPAQSDASPNFPPLQPGYKATALSVPFGNCGPYPSNNTDYKLVVQGQSPLFPAVGKAFNITNLQLSLVGPGATLALFTYYYGLGGSNVTLDVLLGKADFNGDDLPGPGLGIQAMNAQPSLVDLSRAFLGAAQDLSINSPGNHGNGITRPLSGRRVVPGNSTDDVDWIIPQAQTIGLGPFMPGSGVFALDVLNMQGTVYGFATPEPGIINGYVTFNCTAMSDMEVFSAFIAS